MVLLISISAFALDAPPKDAVPSPVSVFNFDHDAPGKPPLHFTPAITGKGPAIRWEVKQDHLAPSLPNVLVQSGTAPFGDNFALALLNNVMVDHGEISVRFKVLSGEEDQAAGIVYHYKDPNNYDVIRASAQSESCALYQIKKGKVTLVDSKDVMVSPYTWHDLHVTFAKETYTALLDGELVLGGKDSSFKDAGQVGLWTKSDSMIAFDDFRVSQ